MSNYNKKPFISIPGNLFSDWETIIEELKRKIKESDSCHYVLVVECYQGVNHNELMEQFKKLEADLFIQSTFAFLPEDQIRELTFPDVTDDATFGYITRLSYSDFIDPEKADNLRKKVQETTGLVIVYGSGAASIIDEYDCLVYADMARWEIQLRQRQQKVCNLGIYNQDETPGIQYKRGYFVDWRICDKLKQELFDRADYWLDTNKANEPKMIKASTMLDGMNAIIKTPFRLVPYFDPGPWGGQWMKEVCGLDKKAVNYAWAFDGVPEENSLLFEIEGTLFEMPCINLVLYKSNELLGEPVVSRFGKEFPIRFDFLDTMGGGNLSLQVHPTTQYIRDAFGMNYTQDESYYMLDTKEDATVYLGVKTGVNHQEMIADLHKAQDTGSIFNAEKYVNVFPAKKHDHFLIPNGTIHCSGSNSMVLEISATPYIFTFKLYDWDRLGMDGEPRAINLEHGKKVIQYERDTEYCLENLVGQVETVATGEGWVEERTGLHKNEFIETRRHWFSKKVLHYTNDSVNVLNLIEGAEAIVESPTNAFTSYVVHYAETFIVPAAVLEYTIRPYGLSEGKECATIKAYVRHKA
ncbi:MAG: mannose-6-phosphate isomerase [Paludibacter sp.]|nr:mannose-6-phosphate isomerase [Paludibacter sp.]